MAYPALEAAVKGPVVRIVVGEWTRLAEDDSQTGGYIRGLHAAESVLTDYRGNPLSVVVQNVAPYERFVELGHGGFHLPAAIKQWKFSKKGKPRIIVPFRHFAPASRQGGPSGRAMRAMMPTEIYKRASQLERAYLNPFTNKRLSGFGDLYKQSKSYFYYRALGWPNVPKGELHTPRSVATLRWQVFEGYTWKASLYEGLIRTAVPTPGGGFETAYMTFRTITPESQGWYIPPVPGKHYTDQVIERTRPDIEEVIAQAAAQDFVDKWAVAMNGAGMETS